MKIAFASVVLVVFAGLSLGQSNPPIVLDSLISQLGADDSRIRDAAQTLIVAMGNDAQEPIEALAENAADPDVRKRAQEILRQITVNSILRPSLISLDVKDTPAKQVYEALFAQASGRLVTAPDTLFDDVNVPVTIKLEKVPFWQAMDAVEDQTGLALGSHGPDMVLMKSRHRRDLVYIKGPFMVVAESPGRPGTIRGLDVFVEPKFRVLNNALQADIDQATDDRGNPLDRPGTRWNPQMGGFGSNAFKVLIGRSFRHVRGSVPAVVATREETVEIPDIAQARNVEKKVNGRRFMIDAANPDPHGWFKITVAAVADPPTPTLLQMRLSVVDAQGNALQSGGHSRGGDKHHASFTYQFRQGPACGPPAKLIMAIPGDVHEIRIPFEFDQADLRPRRRPRLPAPPPAPAGPVG